MATVLVDIFTVFGIVLLAAGVFAVEELVSFAITRIAKHAGASKTVSRDIRAALRVAALVIVLSNVLSLAGLSSLTTTLTVSGVTAIAASLALQNTLSNVISGILLFSDGVIRLDDEIEYGGLRGTVVRVALRNTWVRKQDGNLAVVSNSTLAGGPLVNYSARNRLSNKYGFD